MYNTKLKLKTSNVGQYKRSLIMRIVKTSQLTGNTHTMSIDVTIAQLNAWADGALIQDAMPNLNPDEREFIMTGITPDEWDAAFEDLDETYSHHYV